MRTVIIGVVLLLVSCSQGVTTKVDVTIRYIYDNPSAWGCIGTNRETYVQAADGRMAKLCGAWGAPGDKLTVFWTEGHWDAARNGVSMSR